MKHKATLIRKILVVQIICHYVCKCKQSFLIYINMQNLVSATHVSSFKWLICDSNRQGIYLKRQRIGCMVLAAILVLIR